MRGSLFGLVALVVVFALVLPSVGIAVNDTATVKNTTETVAMQAETTVTLSTAGADGVTGHFDNETVSKGTDTSGSTLTEGTDYDFYTGNATLRFYNTSEVNSGDNATIAYNYSAVTDRTATGIGILGSFGSFIGLLVLCIAVVIVFGMTVAGGGW